MKTGENCPCSPSLSLSPRALISRFTINFALVFLLDPLLFVLSSSCRRTIGRHLEGTRAAEGRAVAPGPKLSNEHAARERECPARRAETAPSDRLPTTVHAHLFLPSTRIAPSPPSFLFHPSKGWTDRRPAVSSIISHFLAAREDARKGRKREERSSTLSSPSFEEEGEEEELSRRRIKGSRRATHSRLLYS